MYTCELIDEVMITFSPGLLISMQLVIFSVKKKAKNTVKLAERGRVVEGYQGIYLVWKINFKKVMWPKLRINNNNRLQVSKTEVL